MPAETCSYNLTYTGTLFQYLYHRCRGSGRGKRLYWSRQGKKPGTSGATIEQLEFRKLFLIFLNAQLPALFV